MSKKNSWREPPHWGWQWPHGWEERPGYWGTAHVLEDNGGPSGDLRAAIYLPDPDSQTGWQLHQVYSDAPQPPSRRKLGL